jgi:chemotaxis protein methyltransferase CheR
VTADEARARLRTLATERLGLAPSALVDARVDSALLALTPAGGTAAALDALPTLAVNALLWQALVDALTVGETNFFRQPGWFAQLEAQILRPAIERRRLHGPKRLRIWSAGCASGEEAYSLAIVVMQLLPKTDDWEISIIGTDVSATSLAAAQRAVYREWSVRDVDAGLRAQHFRKLDSGQFELATTTRAMVSFELVNLAAAEAWDARLTDFDLIVCRNVLMYFAVERQRAIAQRLIERIAPDGWLATAPAEATAEWFRPLVPMSVPSAVLFHHAAPAETASAVRKSAPSDNAHPKATRPPLSSRAQPEGRSRGTATAAADKANAELSDSAAALAAARISLDTSIRRSGE